MPFEGSAHSLLQPDSEQRQWAVPFGVSGALLRATPGTLVWIPWDNVKEIANRARAAKSASQQLKHPEQVENLAFSAFDAGECSPASTLALANIQVLQMHRQKIEKWGLYWVLTTGYILKQGSQSNKSHGNRHQSEGWGTYSSSPDNITEQLGVQNSVTQQNGESFNASDNLNSNLQMSSAKMTWAWVTLERVRDLMIHDPEVILTQNAT
ncbi:hypothetical protein F5051DRAFT_430116 [Lentinula edodes]|nr:hypothetical protein F5051DRAFT_430116 [Lentinula edodes]